MHRDAVGAEILHSNLALSSKLKTQMSHGLAIPPLETLTHEPKRLRQDIHGHKKGRGEGEERKREGGRKEREKEGRKGGREGTNRTLRNTKLGHSWMSQDT
jgi:hypothetical protein